MISNKYSISHIQSFGTHHLDVDCHQIRLPPSCFYSKMMTIAFDPLKDQKIPIRARSI